MIITGKVANTTYTDVTLDIPASKLLVDIMWSAMKNKPAQAEYVRDGFWYVHYFYDYHKREDVEKQDRALTDDEAEIYAAYKTLLKAVS